MAFYLFFDQVNVQLTIDDVSVTLNKWYAQPNGDSIYLNEMKFYLILPSDSLVLVDISEQASLHLPFFPKDDETVLLRIGMDSVMNTCGRLDGPYDPLLGMYWDWNTGYTQLKCKGIACRAGKQYPFEYHLGGYRSPHATNVQQWVRLKEGQPLFIHLESFLLNLPVQTHPKIMLPGSMAHQLFMKFTEGFE
ncbi:MAG: MbnP family protein [Flavobacteriales bacterium]